MSRLQTIIDSVEELYLSNLPEADEWADWAYENHVKVVAKHAERLAEKYGANKEYAVAGAYLHDIADAVMDRSNSAHESKSLELAHQMLEAAGFESEERDTLVNEIIKPHGCNDLMPESIEAKILASADGAAHFTTDFYLYFCWMHFGPQGRTDQFREFKKWVLKKIEKDFNRKIFFDDFRHEVRPYYESIKRLFSS